MNSNRLLKISRILEGISAELLEMSGEKDIVKEIFDAGVALVGPSGRSLIGKLRATIRNDAQVLALIHKAGDQVDPKSFLAAAAQGRMGWRQYAEKHNLEPKPGESTDQWQARVESHQRRSA